MNALLWRWRAKACCYLLAIATAWAVVVPSVSATPFLLQSNTVILEEREGRATFNITNPGSEPILLLTRLDDLDDQHMAANVLVTPTVTRIDPGQSQIVNFSLKAGTRLDREYMLRASFEGVVQRSTSGMRMPIRQQIGLIMQPRSVAVSTTPWQDLKLSASGRTLKVHNDGRHVVRLGPALTLQPGGAVATLPHPYLMPGQRIELELDKDAAAGAAVEIIPLSRYGFANAPERIALVP